MGTFAGDYLTLRTHWGAPAIGRSGGGSWRPVPRRGYSQTHKAVSDPAVRNTPRPCPSRRYWLRGVIRAFDRG